MLVNLYEVVPFFFIAPR